MRSLRSSVPAHILAAVAGMVLVAAFVASPDDAGAQVWTSRLAQEAVCQTLTPAAAGGPLPKNQNLLVLRYLGVSNYELTYRDNVILLDAGIEKLPWWLPTGISRDEMTKRVNGIFIGHAHGEHIWDAPFIAQKTGATVMADAIAMKWIRSTGLLTEKQMVTVTGLAGDPPPIRFNGFTVRAIKGHHNVVPEEYMVKDRAAAEAVGALQPGLNAAEQARLKELGASVPLTAEERTKLITDGTMAYVVTFDNGFTLFYADSAGPTTAAEQQFAKQNPNGIGVGLLPYYGGELAVPITMEYVNLLKPAIVLPTHHDGHRARMLDMPLGPLALTVRDAHPKTRVVSPLYKTPVCIDTATKEMYVGQ
jgi:L-ascorbate metabolism protein UlaG (beta-lactamase superfamily)